MCKEPFEEWLWLSSGVFLNIKPTQLVDGATAPFWLLVPWVQAPIFVWSQCHLMLWETEVVKDRARNRSYTGTGLIAGFCILELKADIMNPSQHQQSHQQ